MAGALESSKKFQRANVAQFYYIMFTLYFIQAAAGGAPGDEKNEQAAALMSDANLIMRPQRQDANADA